MAKILRVFKITMLSMLVFFAGQAKTNAGVLSLSQTPLFLGAAIQPNVFFMLDDSGSMDWEYLVPSSYWYYQAYDPDPYRDGSYDSSSNGSDLKTDGYLYILYDTGVNGAVYDYIQLYAYDNASNASWFDHVTCAARYSTENCTGANSAHSVDWRLRSNGFNKMWYTPNNVYTPWLGACLNNGSDCVDADFRSVRSNPREGESGYGELRDLATDGSGEHTAYIYDVWVDDAGYAGNQPNRGNNQNYTPGANGEVDLWDSHLRFTVDASTVSIDQITYAPANQSGLNEATAAVGTLSNVSACYDILGAINTTAIPALNATGGVGCRTITETQQNIANWYQYNRKRMLAAKSAIATVVSAQPNFRYGLSLFNEPGALFIEMPGSSANITSHNLALKDSLFTHDQADFATPLRAGLDLAGRYFSGSLANRSSPILHACQKNFTILLTDGYYNNSNFAFANSDGDGFSGTAADVAYHYYINDLNLTMPNQVKVDPGEEDIDINGDKLTFQHMVTFTVAFGVEGAALSDGNNDGWPDVDAAGSLWAGANGQPTKNGNWGQPILGNPSTVDDIWHAAFNSNGIFASASSAAEVADKLIDAISNIAGRIGSASAVALNSGTLNANSRVYQAKFDSNDWSGSLVSIPIKAGQATTTNTTCSTEALGELCPEEWNAAEKLEAMNFTGRKVFTLNTDTNTAVTFDNLNTLGAAQQIALRTHPDTALLETASIGQDRLEYILGNDNKEGVGSADFRVRKTTSLGTSKLGDIIHSSPAFSGSPDSFYPDLLEGGGNSYNAFRIANKNRASTVYVGANDGMLHAFNAADGAEEFAYVPGALVKNLNRLSSQNYNNNHVYYVDGSPKIFDAFDGSAWKTLLASSVGGGGQVVFGLDVTNPTTFKTSDVKWEFSDRDDADLGYTMGDVSFARMNNNQWVVIFGNGYNNTEADGNASGTGNAAIYIVDAFTGALVQKFDTGMGMLDDPLNPGSNRPNGMARVTPVDIDGDFNVDYLYAGDLFGNVWKIDVSSSTPSAWDFAYKSGGNPKPFFIAKDVNGKAQAITAGVAVKRHPEKKSQTLILFGTGKYFEVGDSSIPGNGGQIQSFYSIWDDNTASQYSRTALLQQEILDESSSVVGADGITRQFRVTSSAEQAVYKVDWNVHKGWYMDLRFGNVYGERVVIEPVIRSNRVIFVTLIPDDNPCSDGGEGWIMELNADSGSRLPSSPFDVNGDGIIDGSDFVAYSSADTVVSGVKSRSGIVAKPGILNNPQGSPGGADEYKYFSGTNGKVDIVGESANGDARKRQSWRQKR